MVDVRSLNHEETSEEAARALLTERLDECILLAQHANHPRIAETLAGLVLWLREKAHLTPRERRALRYQANGVVQFAGPTFVARARRTG